MAKGEREGVEPEAFEWESKDRSKDSSSSEERAALRSAASKSLAS